MQPRDPSVQGGTYRYDECGSDEDLDSSGDKGLVAELGAATYVESVFAVTPDDTPSVTSTPSPAIAARAVAIWRNVSRFNTTVLVPLPLLPFSAQHDVPELVHFTRAIHDAVESLCNM